MKTKFTLLLLLAALFQGRAQISYSMSPGYCYGAVNGNTASANAFSATATSYSWAIAGSNCSNATITPGVASGSVVTIAYCGCGIYTISVSAYNGSTLLGTSVNTVQISCTPSISVVATSTVGCVGQTYTMSASGAATYSWSNGVFGQTTVVSPSVSTCYSVGGTAANGCSNFASLCIIVNSAPVLTVSPMQSICAGQSATLWCMGAMTYTWLPGMVSSANMVVSPLSTTMYTVIASNGICTSSATVLVVVNPVPSVSSISASSNSICLGNSSTLIATVPGATAYAWTGPGGIMPANSATTVVTPFSSGCYTVTATNSNGCTVTGVKCIGVNALPAISIAGPYTVCLGSSATFTASGALTYTWAPSVFTATLNVIPTSTAMTMYTVTGTNAAGCVNMATVNVAGNAGCADVWPGDANSDGVVGTTDVLEIGFAFSATGAARSATSNAYTSQYATAWTGTVSSGKNRSHADCNGDGTVNNDDTLAIWTNFSMTHSFRPGGVAANEDIFIVPPTEANFNKWAKADVMLGKPGSPVQLLGVAFNLTFDQQKIQPDSVYLVYTSSFLEGSGQNVRFRKKAFNSGTIYAASVRKNGVNASGEGKIAEVYFKVKEGAGTDVINLGISNVTMINGAGVTSALNGGTTAVLVVATGLSTHALPVEIALYPNPASRSVTFYSKENANYEVYDLTGRKVMNGSFQSSATIDISTLDFGTYFVRFESNGNTTVRRMIVE
jgi:hypothetical protein